MEKHEKANIYLDICKKEQKVNVDTFTYFINLCV